MLWVLGGLIVGVIAGATRGTFIDRALMILSLIGVSIPVFWLGEVANLLTQSRWHDTWLFSWVPPLGYIPLTKDPWGWFKALVIPWFTLATLYVGLYGRVLRASLIEMMQEDFIRTARAKGIGERRVLLHHGLRTSLVAFVTMFGLDFGALVGGGALLTEVVFGLQGVGKLTYEALQTLDLPMILATVIYASFFVVMANFVVDVVFVFIDPEGSRCPLTLPFSSSRVSPYPSAATRGWCGLWQASRLPSSSGRSSVSSVSPVPAKARPCWPSWG
ncbi:ABC transporter permease [Mesorhizobium sp.]|uniref:ABC transporter permease n=1 Tax=Mesorhizobium sp. TaxID=1871066 RepID=UPI0025803D3A|nr:ABC transporter permease [Mesorhizobium sp.]